MGILIRLVLNAIALFGVEYIVPGIHIDGFVHALLVAAILGIVNAVLRPILFLITLPLQILTLGLFTLIINGFLFWLVGTLHIGLTVDGFWPAFWGAIVMTIISWLLSALTGSLDSKEPRRA